jgi:hypothetical protein
MNDNNNYHDYMDSDRNVYVEVNKDRQRNGQLVPLSFVWEDGTRYEIDKVLDIRPAASLKAGGAGIRYTVKVRNKEICMYLEEERGAARWFMERR